MKQSKQIILLGQMLAGMAGFVFSNAALAEPNVLKCMIESIGESHSCQLFEQRKRDNDKLILQLQQDRETRNQNRIINDVGFMMDFNFSGLEVTSDNGNSYLYVPGNGEKRDIAIQLSGENMTVSFSGGTASYIFSNTAGDQLKIDIIGFGDARLAEWQMIQYGSDLSIPWDVPVNMTPVDGGDITPTGDPFVPVSSCYIMPPEKKPVTTLKTGKSSMRMPHHTTQKHVKKTETPTIEKPKPKGASYETMHKSWKSSTRTIQTNQPDCVPIQPGTIIPINALIKNIQDTKTSLTTPKKTM